MFSFILLFLGSEYSPGPNADIPCTDTPCTAIPWRTGLRRGSALEVEEDSMLVREEGFYFVYSQVGLLAVMLQFVHMGVLLVCLPGREHIYIYGRKKKKKNRVCSM